MNAPAAVYFEDIALERPVEYGSIPVSAEAIKAFARDYDPQPFHLDEDAARRTHFAGLAASGWHTCAMMMRLLVDNCFSRVAGLGSPGFDDLRWLRPVRPGDELHVRARCTDKAPSRSRADRGRVRMFVEVLNQRDEVVMSVALMAIIARRHPDTAR